MMACATPLASRMATAMVLASTSTTPRMPSALLPLHAPHRSIYTQGNKALRLGLLLPKTPSRRSSANFPYRPFGELLSYSKRLLSVCGSTHALKTQVRREARERDHVPESFGLCVRSAGFSLGGRSVLRAWHGGVRYRCGRRCDRYRSPTRGSAPRACPASG